MLLLWICVKRFELGRAFHKRAAQERRQKTRRNRRENNKFVENANRLQEWQPCCGTCRPGLHTVTPPESPHLRYTTYVCTTHQIHHRTLSNSRRERVKGCSPVASK